jgi:hypothetical protein
MSSTFAQLTIENEVRAWEDMASTHLTQDQYHFVETIVDSVPADDQEAAVRLRALDHVANTAGLASSPSFDLSGHTRPPQGT